MSHLPGLSVIFVGTVLFSLPMSASFGANTQKVVPSYPLASSKHCNAGYYGTTKSKVFVVKVGGKTKSKKTHYVECVLVPKKGIKIDPSFTQSHTNPMDITWQFSARAGTDTVANGQLPSGVLRFTLENNSGFAHTCVVNVGGTHGDGACQVTLLATGAYTDIVEYDSGGQSTSETESVSINPFTTTTTTSFTSPVTISNAHCTQLLSTVPTGCTSTFTTTVTDQYGNVLSGPKVGIGVGPYSQNFLSISNTCSINWYNVADGIYGQAINSPACAGTFSDKVATTTGSSYMLPVTVTFFATPGYSASTSTTQNVTVNESP